MSTTEPRKSAEETAARPGESEAWERELIRKLAFAALAEQRRARRWGILFKLLILLYLVALFVVYFPQDLDGTGLSPREHTALVDLRGVIADDTDASAEQVIKGLQAAFEDKNAKGVILRINSPGGSPVQAAEINGEIERLRKKYPKKPIYAVVTDACASGAYYVAVATDRIYANQSSIVGSIGVLMSGFGFTDAMKTWGIERRLLVAGDRKGMLDSFSPAEPRDLRYVQGLLAEIHAQFIAAVKQGRGDRLRNSPDLFSGLFWTGEGALALGLIDGFGSASYVAREVIGAKEIVDYTEETNLLDRFAKRFGAGAASALTGLAQSPGLY